MKISYQEMNEIVKNIARKYSRNTTIETEDFEQELWLWLCECDNGDAIHDIKEAVRICVNRAIDLSRKNWNQQKHVAIKEYEMSGSHSDSYLEDVSYAVAGETKLSNRHLDDFEYDTVLTKDLVERCEDEKVRKYIVIMGYLNGGLTFLHDMFIQYYMDLSSDKVAELLSYSNQRYTTNVVARVFFNLSNGSSGTMRSIVWRAKEYLGK